jgi:protein Mpv17
MSILERKDPAKKIASSYADALTANWTVWPLVQTVNFKYAPLEGRLLFVNVVSLGEYGREFLFFFSFGWLERVEDEERLGYED